MIENIIKPGMVVGEGGRSFTVENVTKELIYVRGAQEGNPLRLIPTELIQIISQAVKEGRITLQDINRRYRADNNLPHLFDELQLNYDKYILGYDATIQKLCEFVLENPYTSESIMSLPPATQLPKPFILLAGISGTGKSRFVREQAGVHGQDDNFCMVAVRPDWHEPGDLLGYVSRLSGTNKYVATDVLGFMARAWKSLHSRGLKLDASSGQTTRLSGSASLLDAVASYWLCLDEMNLAPVEQYFADYLSLIETRHWQHSPDGAFTYSCDALLKGSVLGELEQAAQQELARNLGLGDISPAGDDYGLWQHFLRHGIAIAPNLIVAGTVNMDETTHGFSRKVIDRAMSFDFGEFFPNDFDDYLAGTISHVPLSFARQSSGRDAVAKEAAAPSIEFLKAVNGVLQGSPFELAYRALNELLLAVDCHGSPAPGRELQAVWDDFLMQKLLPRIEGDADKLQDGQDGNANLLTRLRDLLENQMTAIWEQGNTRPDFYRLQNGQPVTTECRSRRKIDWMLKRLDRSGFTSFWP